MNSMPAAYPECERPLELGGSRCEGRGRLSFPWLVAGNQEEAEKILSQAPASPENSGKMEEGEVCAEGGPRV